jgi:hypothetical protein
MAYFKILSWYEPRETEQNHEIYHIVLCTVEIHKILSSFLRMMIDVVSCWVII